ncbi:Serine/threonine protein kinase, partial [Giardia duodenalis]
QRKFIHRRGGLAPFTNDSPLDLSRYQIERTGEGFANSKDTCFLYALKQSKQLSDEEIRYAAFHINQAAVTFNMADAIGKRLHMHMDGRVVLKGSTGRDLPDGVSLRNIHLGFDFNQALPYSKCYINHIKVMMEHKAFPTNANIRGVYLRDSFDPVTREPCQRLVVEYHRDDDIHTCTSRDLILALHEQGLLPPIRTDDALAIKESFIREEHYEEDVLEYCEGQLKEIVPAKRPKMPQRVWFADFETTTSTTRSSSASTERTTRRRPSGCGTTRASSRWSSPPSRASPSSAAPSRCTSTI